MTSLPGSGHCEPPWTGAMTSLVPASGSSSPVLPCSPVAGRSMRPGPSATRTSTRSSRWSPRALPGRPERGSGCWRLCASTRSSASRSRPGATACGTGTPASFSPSPKREVRSSSTASRRPGRGGSAPSTTTCAPPCSTSSNLPSRSSSCAWSPRSGSSGSTRGCGRRPAARSSEPSRRVQAPRRLGRRSRMARRGPHGGRVTSGLACGSPSRACSSAARSATSG